LLEICLFPFHANLFFSKRVSFDSFEQYILMLILIDMKSQEGCSEAATQPSIDESYCFVPRVDFNRYEKSKENLEEEEEEEEEYEYGLPISTNRYLAVASNHGHVELKGRRILEKVVFCLNFTAFKISFSLEFTLN